MKETPERNLDPQLWHACAGGMVQMPPVNSKVFYFPQGHAEHTCSAVNFSAHPNLPPLILCRVAAVKFLADSDTDEVYSKISLVPLKTNDLDHDYSDDDGLVGANGSKKSEKPTSFAKTLTQSDANNGGGFSVPRYCAETIFPPLDYSADPPVQTVIAKDVHGGVWKFRHIYRGTPRRHLLTTGWSNFVNQKKLVAGDLIVFLRTENGELCVGIRRAKRRAERESPWSSAPANQGTFLNCIGNDGFKRNERVRAESVIKAASLAAKGQQFEVVYSPRASTPEFCVKALAVREAIRVRWCSGMRFKMAFETEDSSRISWFMGTIGSVQVADRLRWPNSPWRLLQVTWDEPDLLQNVKCVSPWLVELVSNVPVITLSPFSPSRKKLRLHPQHPDFPLDAQFSVPSFSGNPLGPRSPVFCLSDNTTPAGIQGARQTQFGSPLSVLHFSNKLHPGLFQSQPFDPRKTRDSTRDEYLSCTLTMGSSSPNLKKSDSVKKHQFFLFGQPILTEQQISQDHKTGHSRDVSRCAPKLQFLLEKPKSSDFSWHQGFKTSELGLETGHCKVFMESEDVGRTLDLSALSSYQELYQKLANMFGIEKSEFLSLVLYRDARGAVRQAGDEPFSDFMKSAKRLTIMMDSTRNKIGRTWITGMRNADTGLDASNKRGPLSIFA